MLSASLNKTFPSFLPLILVLVTVINVFFFGGCGGVVVFRDVSWGCLLPRGRSICILKISACVCQNVCTLINVAYFVNYYY